MKHRIGILGGYGRTGSLAAQEFAKLPDVEVVLGGRDIGKANEVLRTIGNGSIRAAAADVYDPESLKRFCRDTDIVINCTSPTCSISDRAAQAAADAGAHFVDPGGYTLVLRSMKKREAEIAAKRRSCLLSAGLFPGIVELLAQHLVEQFDEPESLDFYMDGRSEMSSTVFEDTIHFMFPVGVGSWERGAETARNKWTKTVFEFPKPIGKQRVLPILWPEIGAFAAKRRLSHLGWHVGTNVQFLAVKDVIPLLFKNHTRLGSKLLKMGYDLEISKYGDVYLFIFEVEGRKNGERRHITAEIVAKGNEHYRLNAVGIVVAAQMIMSGEAAAGVHFLSEAVKPASFMQKLQPFNMQLRSDEKTLARA